MLMCLHCFPGKKHFKWAIFKSTGISQLQWHLWLHLASKHILFGTSCLKKNWGQPCCPVVKFTSSDSVAQGFTGLNPGHGHGTAHQAMLRQCPTCHNWRDPQLKYTIMYWGAYGEKKEKNLKKKQTKKPPQILPPGLPGPTSSDSAHFSSSWSWQSHSSHSLWGLAPLSSTFVPSLICSLHWEHNPHTSKPHRTFWVSPVLICMPFSLRSLVG